MKTFYKLTVVFSIIILAKYNHSYCQIPQAIPFQAVARDTNGYLISGQTIALRMSIHNGTTTGTIIYSEKQVSTTNSLGLFTLNIGQGMILSGNFSSINWGSGEKFLQIEIDVNGGNNFTDMGTQQLLSVPYALYSANSNFYGTLYDTSLIMMNNGDTVFIVDKTGKSFHKGNETFENGITLTGGSFDLKDLSGNNVFSVDSAGNSYHKGLETFDGGITVGGGSLLLVNSEGDPVFEVDTSGNSHHWGWEVFEDGIDVKGGIVVRDGDGNVAFSVSSADGTSTHYKHESFLDGLDIFAGSISMRGSDGSTVFSVDSAGNSYHKGKETFDGGITVGGGSLTFVNSEGAPVFEVDTSGNSHHWGWEVFEEGIDVKGGIVVRDGDGNVAFSVSSADGTSTHYKHESFLDGLDIFAGSISMRGSDGSTVFSVDSAGNSYHKGKETFDGGIEVKNGSLKLTDSNGNVVFSVDSAGVSEHSGTEHFGSGIVVDNSGGTSIIGNGAGSSVAGVAGFAGPINGIGIHGVGNIPGSLAGQFDGTVLINGNLSVIGVISKSGGMFKIDHPLDPCNKYLNHSFVESSDMMNLYNGNVFLDSNGKATIFLPDWFQALNKDFRYQLTCIGGFAPVYIDKEIENNQFTIAGGKPGMKISWSVTGIRHDAFAEKHPMIVEENKPENEIGQYLQPDVENK